MNTFETEKHNIPEGATHYMNQTSYSHFAWCRYANDRLYATLPGEIEWVHVSEDIFDRNIKPIPQTNIGTPEEKEALDSINSNLIKTREPSKSVITKVEWGGAGLPAVGVECEAVFIEHEHKGYGKFLILGYHDNYVWMEYIGELSNKSKHYTSKVNMVKFRKPETEAERVERERANAIYDMCASADNFTEESNFWAGKFYDLGYRKESE